MKFKGDDFNMWDAWFLNVGDTVHAFHLKMRNGGAPVGHLVSRDLLHWERCPDILYPQDEELYPDDCLHKFTGCAFTDSATGEHYVYYTMRDKVGSEKIGVATSRDLKRFTLYGQNPVLTPDPSIFSVKPKGEKTDCRDMLVVEHEGTYYAYFAAMADVAGRGRLGVIGVATGRDLLHFDRQSIAYIPPFDGVVEVPDVFFEDGRWYLTALTGTLYGARGITSERDVACFTVTASAASPLGPFTGERDDLLIAGPANSGYTCRHVDFAGKRYCLYIDRSEDGWALALPKEERVIGQKPTLCYAPILQELRTGRTVAPDAAAFETLRSSFAWETGRAAPRDTADGIVLPAERGEYIRSLLKADPFVSLEAEFRFAGDGECGMYYEVLGADGQPQDRCYIAADIPNRTLTLYTRDMEFRPHARRHCAFGAGKTHMRVILAEGQADVYVDDRLVLQVGTATGAGIRPGIFAGDGRCVLTDLTFYELEK